MLVMKLYINESKYNRDNFRLSGAVKSVYDSLSENVKDDIESILDAIEARFNVLGIDATRTTIDTFTAYRAKKLVDSLETAEQKRVVSLIINRFCASLGITPVVTDRPSKYGESIDKGDCRLIKICSESRDYTVVSGKIGDTGERCVMRPYGYWTAGGRRITSYVRVDKEVEYDSSGNPVFRQYSMDKHHRFWIESEDRV